MIRQLYNFIIKIYYLCGFFYCKVLQIWNYIVSYFCQSILRMQVSGESNSKKALQQSKRCIRFKIHIRFPSHLFWSIKVGTLTEKRFIKSRMITISNNRWSPRNHPNTTDIIMFVSNHNVPLPDVTKILLWSAEIDCSNFKAINVLCCCTKCFTVRWIIIYYA